MKMVKQLQTKLNVLILVDLCKVNYKITYQKLIKKIAKNAWKAKELDENVNLLGLRIID